MFQVKHLRRAVLAAQRRARELQMIAKGLASTDHPILAHVIPMRRCNLACTYCNEFDDFSKPVPVDAMYARLDHLASLGTTIITISGGEPLLHPDLDLIIARIRKHGMIAGMITNGYLLTAERIQRLNRAGLEHLQISIDNVHAGRGFEEEPEGARPETATAGGTRRLPREHQLGGGRRHSYAEGRAGDRQARAGAGLHFHRRHHPRWRRAVAAAAG